MAKKHGVSFSYILKIKLNGNLKSYVVQKVPHRTDEFDLRAKSRAKKLYSSELTNFKGCVLMDDETVAKADFKELSGRSFYTAHLRLGVRKQLKYKKMQKFGTKYMVWQAICTCGKFTRPFVTNGTINRQVYINECLQKRF